MVGVAADAPEVAAGTRPVSDDAVQAVASSADTTIKARMRPVCPARRVVAVSLRGV
ncbi:hypothetical protein GCM10023148_05320 [Actinokineospora soli]